MSESWKEVARLHFKGERYDDHSLDTDALREYIQFQKIVREMAKAIWKKRHPDRRNLPRDFEDRTRLCLRAIEEGSVAVPLEIRERSEGVLPLQEEWHETVEAIEIAHGVFRAAERGEILPKDVTKDILPDLLKLGESLPDDAEFGFAPSGKPMVPITAESRQRLQEFVSGPYEDSIEITGRVFEADVYKKHFHVCLDDGTKVLAEFSEEQESDITSALKDHESVRLRLEGRGMFSQKGKLERAISVTKILTIQDDEAVFDPTVEPIEDALARIAEQIPESDWDNVPTDLSVRHDDYL